MSDELKDIALAEAFLNGELDEAQRQSVETRKASDPEFAQLLADMEIVLEGTREAFRGDIEAQLREMEQGLPPVQIDEAALLLEDLPEEATKPRDLPPSPKPGRPRQAEGQRSRRGWLYAAALIVLLLILWWLWPKGEVATHERLFAEHFEAPARVSGTTRGGDELVQLRRMANDAYDANDFAAAMPLYERLFEEHRDTQALFYLGVVQLGAGAPTAAVESLQEFEQLSTDVRFTQINFLMALAYIRKGEIEKAKTILEKQINDPEAQALLKELDQIGE